MKANIQLGNIQVTSIESSSGIFISQNNFANGWRSQSKENSGFGGSGDQNNFENCLFVVSDEDVIDSPMEDNSVLAENHTIASNNESEIHFKGIEVVSLNQNASISIGDNRQSGWSSNSKGNEGNGEFYGETFLANNEITLKDNDFVDSPVIDKHLSIKG